MSAQRRTHVITIPLSFSFTFSAELNYKNKNKNNNNDDIYRVPLHLMESELMHPIQDRSPAPGSFPALFEKCCGFFKVPCNGLEEVGRLGQRLNVPTQRRRVTQTGDDRHSQLQRWDQIPRRESNSARTGGASTCY